MTGRPGHITPAEWFGIALHEAGHAAVGWLGGVGPYSAAMGANDRGRIAGRATWVTVDPREALLDPLEPPKPPKEPMDRDEFNRQRLFLHAGVAAQFPKLDRDVVTVELRRCAKNDWATIRVLAKAAGVAIEDPDLEGLRIARDFCDANWGAIVAVAEPLFETGYVSCEDVLALIGSAPSIENRSREPWRPVATHHKESKK